MSSTSVPSTNAWRNADRLADGQLAALLVRLRKERGFTFEDIVRTLWADHGVAVSARTLSTWCRQLGTEDGREAA